MALSHFSSKQRCPSVALALALAMGWPRAWLSWKSTHNEGSASNGSGAKPSSAAATCMLSGHIGEHAHRYCIKHMCICYLT